MGNEVEKLIPLHGGYRKLKSFQVAQLAYDVTVRFCDRYHREAQPHARPDGAGGAVGVQNIAEGSQASGTSKKTELKLTNVARGQPRRTAAGLRRLPAATRAGAVATRGCAEGGTDSPAARLDGRRGGLGEGGA